MPNERFCIANREENKFHYMWIFISQRIMLSGAILIWSIRNNRDIKLLAILGVKRKSSTSLMLQSFTEQSSLPLTNFVGSDGEKSTDHALFWCSVYCENPCPVPASQICIHQHHKVRKWQVKTMKYMALYLYPVTILTCTHLMRLVL